MHSHGTEGTYDIDDVTKEGIAIGSAFHSEYHVVPTIKACEFRIDMQGDFFLLQC